MAADAEIAMACALGNLELNPFLPLVADALLGSLDLLEQASGMLCECVDGLEANRARCAATVEGSTATITALLPEIGYERASRLAEEVRQTGRSVREVAVDGGYLTAERFTELTAPEAVLRLGWPDRPGEVKS
jgi:aspartate ammonia-lyase